MQFVDLGVQQARMKDALRARLDAVLAGNHYILGPEVAELEAKLAAFAGVKHCLGCSSGSTALDLALMAWEIGPGDAVLTTPFTFVATAESIARTGATPVFVDIDPLTLNIDAARLEDALAALADGDAARHPLPLPAREKRLAPRAILPVDIFGRPAEYDEILAVAKRHGLKVLEDGAQSFGGRWRGKPLCGCGCDAAATSFFPTKPLGCYGDGGAVFTDDDAMAERADSLRYHGRASKTEKYENVRLGMNGRLDTLQAAVLLAKWELFPTEIELRDAVAVRYDMLIRAAGLPERGLLPPPLPSEAGSRSVWAQYTVQLPPDSARAAVASAMKARGVPTAVHYPKGLHRQTAFARLGYRPEDFPVTERASARVLSLPMHPYLEEAQQREVIAALADALAADEAIH